MTLIAHTDLMLCGANQPPFSHQDWLFQLKWDGYRALLLRQSKSIQVLSRTGKDMTLQFPELVRDLKELPAGTAIDGELVVRDERGFPVWDDLRRRRAAKTQAKILEVAVSHPAAVMAFDLLACDGKDLRQTPSSKRLEALRDVVKDCGATHYVECYEDGRELYRQVDKLGLEGIVAKRKDSSYVAGRSLSWLKIKTQAGTEKEWNRRR